MNYDHKKNEINNFSKTMLLTAHELLLYVHVERRRHYAAGQTTRAYAVY